MASLGKRIQILVWTVKAFLAKHKKLFGASLLIGLAVFFFISRVLPYIPLPQKHTRIGLVGSYNMDSLPDTISFKLSQGLTAVAQDGSVVPSLAKNWKIEENGRVYTFVLKDDIFWQDGREIKASDIGCSFKDVQVNVLDEKTLEFRLKEPFAPFLAAVSQSLYKNDLVGTGPFKLDKFKKRDNELESVTISDLTSKLTFIFYPNIDTAKLAFKRGEVDVLEDLFMNPFEGEENWQGYLDIEAKVQKDRYIALFYNNKDEFLGDKNLRQALTYAINENIKGENKVLSPINPHSWAFNPQVKKYEFNPDHSRRLFEKFTKDEGEEIIIRLSTSQSFLGLAEAVKTSWEEVLGVKVQVEIINSIPSDYQVFLGIQETPDDPDQYALWHSTRAENITNFNDPRVDKLLEDARKTQDKEERQLKYYDFQKFLLEEAPAAFLKHPKSFRISKKTLF